MSIDSYDKSIITGGVTSNFIRFVVPSILGLLAISSAGIVDGIFVGNYIGATALAAVNLVVPLYSLFFGVCVMILVGAAVMAGKAVGKGDIQEASNLFSKSMIVVICYALICATLAFIYAENIAIFLGAKEDALPLTSEYIQTIAPFLFFMGMSYTLSTFAKVDNAPNFALAGLLAISTHAKVFSTLSLSA